MEINTVNISNPSVFYICVDGILRGDEMGRLYHVFSERPFYFQDTGRLFKTMDTILDYLDFPQASMTSRRFIDREDKTVRGKKTVMEVKNKKAKEQRGNKATFIVHVRYRQHASWQGEVTWVESRQSVGFRSALELMKLIDSALDGAEEKKVAQ